MRRFFECLSLILLATTLVSCKKHSVISYKEAADRHLYQNELAGKGVNYAGVQKHLVSCALHEDTSPSNVKAKCLLMARALQLQHAVNIAHWPVDDSQWAVIAANSLNKSCGDNGASSSLECLIAFSVFHSEINSKDTSFSDAYINAIESIKECALAGEYSCIDGLIQAAAYSSQVEKNGRFSSASISACLADWKQPDFACLFGLSSYRVKNNEVALKVALMASQYGLSIVRQCANSGNPFCMSRWAIALYSGDCQSESESGDAVKWFSLAA